MLERQDIEGRSAEVIAGELRGAFDKLLRAGHVAASVSVRNTTMSNSSQLNVLNNDFTLTITDEAAKRVRDVVNGGLPETAGLRVGVVGGGCSGLTYDVIIVVGPQPGDTILEINNTRVFVNESSAQYLNGMIVDWISSMQESRFVFQNPNETGNCGCGKSFSVDTASSQQSSGQ